jgi:hypothetical protein
MHSAKVHFVVLVLAGCLVLTGCHTLVWIPPADYKRKPELLREGEQVTIRTTDQVVYKGKVVDRTAANLTLDIGHRRHETIPADLIASIEVKRSSDGKTFGAALLITAGVALIVGIIYGIGYLFSHTA